MTDHAQEPRSSLGLLLDRQFGWFFVGRLFSTAGIWIHNIVAAIVAYQVSRSALVVGLVSVAQFGPGLVFAPLSGAMADRGNRRYQIIIGEVIVAAASGCLAIWLVLVGVEGLPGAWPVIAAALLAGFGFVLVTPAQNALVPALVRPAELPQAVTLYAVPPTAARAAGPAAGALIAATSGPATAYIITAATALVYAAVIASLRVRSTVEGPRERDRSAFAGFRHLSVDRSIALLLVGVLAIGVGADPVITLTPSLADQLGGGSELVGLLASAFGVGAGVAFIIVGALRRGFGAPRVWTAGLLLLSVGIGIAGVGGSSSVALPALFIAGLGMTFALTSLTGELQLRLPDRLRGRVMALWSMAFLGSRPFAATANGAIADLASPAVAFVGVALVVLAAAAVCRPSALRNRSMEVE